MFVRGPQSTVAFSQAVGLLGGGVAWLVHLMVAWAIAEFGCVAGLGHRFILNVSLVAWLVLLVSIAMAGAAALAAAVPYVHARRSAAGQVQSQSRYLLCAGAITSAAFVLIIIVQTVPVFFHLIRC